MIHLWQQVPLPLCILLPFLFVVVVVIIINLVVNYYLKNLIRGISTQFNWKRLQNNYESYLLTKEESCKINPGIWKGYCCWRWWRITTFTISSRDIQFQIILTYLNTYTFSLTSMYSEQIIGFLVYFWIGLNLIWKRKKVLLSAVKKEEVGQRDLCHRRDALFVIIYNYDNEKEGRYHEKSVFFNFILNHQFITRGA